MPIAHWKEVTVLNPWKMRDCYPVILIHFIRIRRCHACLSSKSKFGHTIRKHLGWVWCLIRELRFWLQLKWRLLLLSRLNLTLQHAWSWSFLMHTSIMRILICPLYWLRLIHNLLLLLVNRHCRLEKATLCLRFQSLIIAMTSFLIAILHIQSVRPSKTTLSQSLIDWEAVWDAERIFIFRVVEVLLKQLP